MDINSISPATYDLNEINRSKTQEFAGAIAYTLIVILVGIAGNSMCIAYYGFKVPRTANNVIITLLASVDLTACVVLSDLIIKLCFSVAYKNRGSCKVLYFVNRWLIITSGFMLLFVAIDRYRKICRPFGWQLSIKYVKIAFFGIVIAAM